MEKDLLKPITPNKKKSNLLIGVAVVLLIAGIGLLMKNAIYSWMRTEQTSLYSWQTCVQYLTEEAINTMTPGQLLDEQTKLEWQVTDILIYSTKIKNLKDEGLSQVRNWTVNLNTTVFTDGTASQ